MLPSAPPHSGKAHFNIDPRLLELLGERRCDSRRHELSFNDPVCPDAGLLEAVELLHRDDSALEAGDLGHVAYTALTIGIADELHCEMERRCDLLADRANGQVEA